MQISSYLWIFMYNTYGELYNYDITVTWPEVQNGGPRAAGSQVSMIHNFLILYPILLKFSLVCLNKVQLYYRSNFPLGLHSPLMCQTIQELSQEPATFVVIWPHEPLYSSDHCHLSIHYAYINIYAKFEADIVQLFKTYHIKVWSNVYHDLFDLWPVSQWLLRFIESLSP